MMNLRIRIGFLILCCVTVASLTIDFIKAVKDNYWLVSGEFCNAKGMIKSYINESGGGFAWSIVKFKYTYINKYISIDTSVVYKSDHLSPDDQTIKILVNKENISQFVTRNEVLHEITFFIVLLIFIFIGIRQYFYLRSKIKVLKRFRSQRQKRSEID